MYSGAAHLLGLCRRCFLRLLTDIFPFRHVRQDSWPLTTSTLVEQSSIKVHLRHSILRP